LAIEIGGKKKRKLSLMLLGTVALIVIVIANIIVWRGYSDKQAQADALKINVQAINQQIAQASTAPPSDLESQLAEEKNKLADALLVLPENTDRNDVIDFILSTAEGCQVDLVPLVADGGGAGGSGQFSYQLRYHGTIRGTISQVSSFMTKLHTTKYPTMMITECTVQRVNIDDVSTPGNDIAVTVNFNIAFYVSSIKGK
jgi:type II secretory pathway pseudopilin PulG